MLTVEYSTNMETPILDNKNFVAIDCGKITQASIQLLRKQQSDAQKTQDDFNALINQRLDSLDETQTTFAKRIARLEEQYCIPNQETVLMLHCGRLLESLTNLRGLEDIREQLQYSTLVLKALDRMFAACSEKTERFHRQLILKLRSAIKLNCDKNLFTEKQLDLLVKLAEDLRMPDLGKAQVLTALDCLMAADLSPFPSLEDDDETVSGHNGSN